MPLPRAGEIVLKALPVAIPSWILDTAEPKKHCLLRLSPRKSVLGPLGTIEKAPSHSEEVLHFSNQALFIKDSILFTLDSCVPSKKVFPLLIKCLSSINCPWMTWWKHQQIFLHFFYVFLKIKLRFDCLSYVCVYFCLICHQNFPRLWGTFWWSFWR